MTTSSANNSVFRGFFEKQKLTGLNFIDWYRQLRIVLSIKDKLNYLEQLISPAPVAPAGQHVAPEILAAHTAWIKGSEEIAGLINGKTVNEFHAMLKLHEQILSKNNAPDLHAIRAEELSTILSRVAEEEKECSFGSWWFRKLKPGALSLYVGNGQREAIEAIDIFYLCLPSGLEIVLNNCHYALPITRGVISVSRLYEDGFINRFVNNTIQVSRNNMGYFSAIPRDVFETFKVFQKEVENQLGKIIKSQRSDHGNEYISQEFLDHLKDHGIITHRTHPYTSKHNGVSKRRNKTLLDMVRSMMSQTTLPKSFWDYALKTAARILNMVPTKKVEKTPYEVWHGQAPKLSYLKVWGCEALVKRDTLTKHDKLEPRSIKCIFIGYPKETIGYSFCYPLENKVLVAQNAEFLENSIITQEASGSLEDIEIIQEEDTHPSIDTSLNHEEDDQEIDEPQKLPPNGKTVGSKWLFKKKTEMDGVVHTYKAHLAAKGYTQTLGIDYEETFSPVADIRAIRILIAIAAYYDYEIWQMDVKIAFLNGYINEEVYMEQPEGFVNPKYPNQKFGFTQNRDEPCVYLKASGSNITFLLLYIDDILFMGNNIPMLQDVKSYIGRCFAMKDLGEAAYILGIKIYRDRSRRLIGLCQSDFIEKILKRYCMENSKHGSIPMQEKLKLSKSQGASTPAELKRMQNISYASAVGSIMYAVRCTRPDVAFTHNTGYVFVLNGGAVDWKSAKQSIFATSSTEAEYIAAFDASKEAVWVRKFIYGLGVVPIIEEPISMYCDNTRAIAIANESGITKGVIHFRAKVHYLPEVIEYGDIKLEKVHTDDNLADPFTKALAFPKHSEHTRNIEMLPASSLM
nr:retrotransposon protein, putative, Ty1-copia subclass [Tanacetum cinerariifolium]